MSNALRSVLVAGAVLLVLPVSMTHAADKEEMIDNPLYKYWAGCKRGSTVVRVETTVLGEADKSLAPDGTDVKTITYRLVNVNKKQAVVLTTITERTFLRTITSAPSRISFPAKVKKAHVEAVLFKLGAEKGEGTVKVAGIEIKCKTLSGTIKRGGQETTYKIWHSEAVPGGVVKEVRTTKEGDKVVAETTTMLKSFKKIK